MRRVLNFATILALVTGLSALSKNAFAAKAPTHDTYSAYEGADPTIQKQAKPVAVKKTSKHKAAAPIVEEKMGFDPVPVEQREPIVRRLKIVEELLLKFGRAYDYRTHTTHDLESILSGLESNMPSPTPGENS